MAVGDFNGDGVPDLAVAESAQRLEGVYVFFGNGDGTFTSGAKLLVGIRPPRSLAVGDFNGDGVADLAVTALGSLNVWVLLSNGDGTFEPERSFDVGCGPTAIAVGDLNGDGALDLAMASNYGKCSVLLGQGDGSFRAAEPLDAGTAGVATAIAVGDFNRDRVPDLAVANWDSNSVSVLLGNGDGTFQAAQSFAVGTTPVALAVGDFDHGEPRGLAVHRKDAQDLVVANSHSNSVSVLINTTPRGARTRPGGASP